MATQQTSSANQTLTLGEGQQNQLSFSSADIRGMRLGEHGSLIISLKDGHTVTISNFHALAGDNAKLALNDGAYLDTKTLEGILAKDVAVNINEPAANAVVTYELAAGQKYHLGFDPAHTGGTVTEKDGSLIITFGDHGQIVLKNFDAAMNGADSPLISHDKGSFVSLGDFLKTVHLADATQSDQQHANNNTPQANDEMADAAQKLAGVEPAAGGNGGGGGGAGGHDFNSQIDPAGLNSPAPIGPIGETELAFGLPKYPQPLGEFETSTPGGPSITINHNPPVTSDVGLQEPDAVVKENGSIIVPISASLGTNASNDILTVTISGIPGAAVGTFSAPIGTYDAAHGTWTVTLSPGENLNTAFTFTPAAFSDVDFGNLHATVSQFDPSSGSTQTASANLYVTTDAVAEVPDLAAGNASEEAGHTTALAITTHEIDPDGSEVISGLTISGVPAGATLNHGTYDAVHNVWDLTQADLTGLTISTTKAVAGGDYTLTVTSTSTEVNLSGKEADFSDNSATNTTTLNLHVDPNSIPVITPPATLSVAEHDLTPTTSVSGNVTANYGIDGPGAITGNNTFTSSLTSLTSDGHPVTVTETGNTYTGTANGSTIFTLTVGTDGSYTFTLDGPLDHPDASNPHDIIGLNFGVTATDVDGDTATGTITVNVIDDAPVAHDDSVTFFNVPGNVAGNVVTGAGEAAGGADTLSHDGNNHVTSVGNGAVTDAIAPGGDTVIAGTYGNLDIHSDGSYTYVLTNPGVATGATDTFSYTLTDNDGDSSTANLTLVAEGAPTIIINHGPPTTPADVNAQAPDAVVKENGTVVVPVHAELGAGAPASDYLTVTVTGIPGAAVGTFSAPVGTYDAAHGTWTVTLAPGQSLDTSFTFTPTAFSDVDFGNMHATVTQNDPATGTSISASTGFYVTTDAVAEAPGLTASNASEEAGHTTALHITTHEVDPDGSEAITGLTLKGLPVGATLNHGTYDAATNTWTLSQSDLSTLTITTTKGTSAGDYTLTVTSTSTEVNLSGKEVDLTDNSATSTQNFNLHIDPNAIPVVTDASGTVDETNLAPTTAVSSTISAAFGIDAPGSFAINNTFSASGSLAGGTLTSDGHAVTVTESGNTYTGTANGETIFTLTLGANGAYTFTLDGTLDHGDKTNPNDAIQLNFGVNATDSDGDTGAGAIHISVLDDAPTAVADVNSFYANIGHTSGDVITGAGELPGGADTLSHDAPDTVTQIQFGTHIVDVPTTGTATIDGTYGELKISADGSYTYTLGAGGTAGGAGSTTDTPHVFTGNSYPTSQPESVPVNPALEGEQHSNMTIGANTSVSGTVTFDGAGYTNSLGMFTVAADGTLESAQMIAPSITGAGVGFNASTGSGGAELGFFLVANGFVNNNSYSGLDFSHGSLSFVYDLGQADQRTANVADDGSKVSLVFTDASNVTHVIDGPVYFTSDRGGSNSLNADGAVHTISGVDTTDPTGQTLKIGFEDLPNGGDQDYNDAVFTVQMTDHSTTAPGSDQFIYTLADGDGDTSKTTLTFDDKTPPSITITVNGGNPITSDTGVQAPDAVVKENHSITIPVTATLSNPSSAGEALTVTISGIPGTVGAVTAANGGVYDAAHGTITWTLAPGASLNSSFSFTPTQYSDVDLGNLHISATATDAASGTVSTSANLYVTTDAVAEVPGLTASNASEEAGHTTALVITTHEVDPDGSEVISGLKISGLPTGATLNHGTYDAVHNVWNLSQSDLTGLTVTTAHGTTPGNYTLTVTSTSTETTFSGHEVDLTDNSATATTTATLSVIANPAPVVTDAASTVDETNLAPTTAVSSAVTASFGIDGPGSYAINNTFSASGSLAGGTLTSDGHAVTVTESGNTYTGTANGHTIFTLALGANGAYTFTLDGTLDHADKTNPNDAIQLNFGVTATDSDGDHGAGTIHVTVLDDAPTAVNDVNNFSASVGHTAGNVISGAGEVAGGADTLSHDAPNDVTQIQFGTHVVNVPATGTATIDGTYGELKIGADGSYTYTLFGTGGLGGGTTTTTAHHFSGNDFPGSLPEGVAITTAERADLGELHSNMAIDANTQVSGTVTFDGAGYTNSLGAYTVAADGTIEAAQMIAPSITGTGANFNFGASTGSQELGFFLVADGFTTNKAYAGLDLAHGTLSFVYDYGQADQRAANVADSGSHVSLVFTDASNHNTVLDGPIYFTTDRGGSNSLNTDGVVHTISGVDTTDPTGQTLKIGFEDLPNGGDNDYNDAVFTVQMTDHTTAPAAGTDQFTYTLADGDGDTSKANLTFNSQPAPTAAVTVNGDVTDAVVKEDHSIFIPITATATGDGHEQMTITLDGVHSTTTLNGVSSDWGVSGTGWVATGTPGEYSLTLAAGVTSYNGGITFTPPANSDVDMDNLHVTTTVTDPGQTTATASANFNVVVDAVVDTPVLTVTGPVNFLWVINQSNPSAIPVSTHVTDTDGSETVDKVVFNLNNPFTNSVDPYHDLADMGVTLNKGTQTAPGIWTVNVNAQDASSALNGLSLITPTTQPYYYTLHNASHTGTITVQSYVSESHTSGVETDTSDNTTVVTQAISYTFADSPLVIDLNNDGFNIVGQSAGVKFDMTNDGQADHTSWVAPTDGLLAIDANHNGTIDNQSELFGNNATATDGFANLAQYDANHDGVINAQDAVFNELTVWQDANQDGVSQANELHSLGSLGITSISLSTTAVNETIADATVTSTSNVTYADGHTTQIGDAWFNVQDATQGNVGATLESVKGYNNVLEGTAQNDVLISHGGNDVLYGNGGADRFVFDAVAANSNATPVIKDFNTAEGDSLDLSLLLSGVHPTQATIDNFVHATSTNGDTTISVDVSGSGVAAHFANVAVLQGVANANIDELLAHGNLLVTAAA